MPKISVIMPTYNHARYVEEAIRSVLAQTYGDFELLIVDDGSTDGTPDVIRRIDDPRIRFRALERNVGACGAVNLMLEQMQGEYYCILNSDDMYLPQKLEMQLDFMTRHPEYVACFSTCGVIDENGQPLADSQFANIFKVLGGTRHDFLRQLFQANFLCHPSVMLRADVLRKAGGFDERLRQLPDHDMWIRVLQHGNIHIAPEPTILFRDHGGNTSGKTAVTLIRSTTEHRYLLDRYLAITDVEEILAIFPALRAKVPNPVPGTHEYLLALAALAFGKGPHNAFAIDTLHRIMGEPEKAALLREAYGFTWHTLHDITGSVDLYRSYTDMLMTGALVSAAGQTLRVDRRVAGAQPFTIFLPLPAGEQARSCVLQFANPNVIVNIDSFAVVDAMQKPMLPLAVGSNASLVAKGATNIYFFSVGGPTLSAEVPPPPEGAAGILIQGAVRATGAKAASMMRETLAKQGNR